MILSVFRFWSSSISHYAAQTRNQDFIQSLIVFVVHFIDIQVLERAVRSKKDISQRSQVLITAIESLLDIVTETDIGADEDVFSKLMQVLLSVQSAVSLVNYQTLISPSLLKTWKFSLLATS